MSLRLRRATPPPFLPGEGGLFESDRVDVGLGSIKSHSSSDRVSLVSSVCQYVSSSGGRVGVIPVKE